jgi:hypothetical protein
MFALDIETLAVESTSVILSVGMTYVSNTEPKSYQDILDNSIFVKLKAKEQIANNRFVDNSTVDWWSKQCDFAKERNFYPKKTDFSVDEGIAVLQKWVNERAKKDDICWIRGSLDQMCLDSLFRSVDAEPLFKYNMYRDVRTAIDIMYPNTSKNGYVDVDPELCLGFDRDQVLKHSPEHDTSYDLAMILFGKQ